MTDIECQNCGHVRETTEENPTLVNCEECGSYDLSYTDHPAENPNIPEDYDP